MIYKKVFVDSDILLDLFLKREPFFIYSRSLLSDDIKEQVEFYTSSLIIANFYYVISKDINKVAAINSVKSLMNIVNVLSFDDRHINSAIEGQHIDFEDRIQYYIARQDNCELIISRNIKHYKKFDIPVLTAEEFLRRILS